MTPQEGAPKGETIKQAIARCRGDVLVQLHPRYSETIAPLTLKVSKPEARKLIVDRAPSYYQPEAQWIGDDLLLLPTCPEEGDAPA